MFKALEKIRNGEKALIVCLGDSITEQNFHLHDSVNYVSRIGEKMINTFGRNQFVFNAGVSGDTTWGAIARLERDALRFKPDLVTLMFGMNDSVRGSEVIPEFKKNLMLLAEEIRKSGSELLLLTQNKLKFEILDNAQRRGSYPMYIEAIREVATEYEIQLCDIYRKWDEAEQLNPYTHWMMMDDEIHPNEHGHRFMAQTIIDYLKI